MANKFFVLHYNGKLEIYEESERRQMLDKVASMNNDRKLSEYDREFAVKLLEGDYSKFNAPGLASYSFSSNNYNVTLYMGHRGVEK